MFAAFYLRRSQPLRYRIPKAKKAMVMTTKMTSLTRRLPEPPTTLTYPSKKRVSATLRIRKVPVSSIRLAQKGVSLKTFAWISHRKQP
jgi:hypothetical protein